ncbi:outer membrane protein with beta-barrel domain [Bradymonas sediminis]|uniref:Uncharacterized protein n=2 Tax=Bradymonas sediminis TaxID=1548548 RepID=A0A2Z4FKP9_9DELT|nr:hypothetical protein DN745_08510 [Bradymonas sediminis]TDP73555.1 outer membrane protein with beta-barrel domain [Bradymonas sediminis]
MIKHHRLHPLKHRRPAILRALVLLAAMGLAMLLRPAPAQASEGYAQTWGGLMLANSNDSKPGGQWGAGAQFGFAAGITDFWSIVGGVETSYHLATTSDDDPPEDIPGMQVLGLFAGFRYNVDIFKYVPYVGLAIENFPLGPRPPSATTASRIGAKLSVGLDWRVNRDYSFGALVELHSALDAPADFPIYSTVGVNLSYHFRL